MDVPAVTDAAWLARHPEAVLADVRWYPDGRSAAGAYDEGHLTGAVRVDVDTVLAAPPSPTGGRHPLPDPERFTAALAALGVGDGDLVVGYDDAGGVIAARLVWMLRAVGRPATLLDGGLLAWSGPLSTTPEQRAAVEPGPPRPWPAALLADIDDAAHATDAAHAGHASRDRDAADGPLLLDARPAGRYRGTPDELDPRAGHIPGAVSLPARENIGPDGCLLPAEELRHRFAAVGVRQGRDVISSCGSGVTACHTLLVIEHLGLGTGRLFPGSWSQWSRGGPGRRAATGPEPYGEPEDDGAATGQDHGTGRRD